jgi:hypothetical protein
MTKNNPRPRLTIKKIFALLFKIILAVVVLAFLGYESFYFFVFIFPDEQWYMAVTGFGLTSGAMIVYLYLFLNDADTVIRKTVALIMMFVGIVGELATAGFGMQMEAWERVGLTLGQQDIDLMILVVRILMFGHGVALVAYIAGDRIKQAFQDDDGDGIPNVLDPVDNRGVVYGAETKTTDPTNAGERR